MGEAIRPTPANEGGSTMTNSIKYKGKAILTGAGTVSSEEAGKKVGRRVGQRPRGLHLLEKTPDREEHHDALGTMNSTKTINGSGREAAERPGDAAGGAPSQRADTLGNYASPRWNERKRSSKIAVV